MRTIKPRLIVRPNETPVWRVEWCVDGARGSRQFKTEAEAYEFLPLIPRSTRKPPSGADVIKARSKVDALGCWVWQMRIHNTGYGRASVGGQRYLAHRLSYESFVGPIPDGLELDHLCRNRACVNPEHLEPVTSRENSARSPINWVGVNVRKTHCPKSHPYDEVNTRVTSTGGRECKECSREKGRRYRQRQMLRAASVPSAVAA